MNKKITIICSNVTFRSLNDKLAFFEWVEKIKAIVNFEIIHKDIHLYFKSNKIRTEDLRELFGLCERYYIDMNQLCIFKNKTNTAWFEN